jgi:hypothetical protein
MINYNFSEFRIQDRDNINDVLGIYAWHLKLKEIDESRAIKLFEIFNSFDIKLSGNTIYNNTYKFGDSFEGNFNRKIQTDEIRKRLNNIDIELLTCFLKHNSIPLYIGRSKKLRKRISEHYKGYLEAMPLISSNSKRLESIEFEEDSEEESSYFGKRLARLNKEKWFNPNELIIHIYENNEKEFDKIKNTEYYLNRLYKPILGLI